MPGAIATAAPAPKRLLSIQEAADYAGLSAWTVRDLVGDGRLASVRLPGVRRVYIKRDDLERLIEQSTERALS